MTFSQAEDLISIRIASSAERHQIQSIRETAFESVRDVYVPRPQSHSTSVSPKKPRTDAIASIDGVDAGVIGVYREASVLRITGLGVLPTFRRRGIASALVVFVEQIAMERDCRSLGLYTIRETGNIPVFLNLGFTLVKEDIADWCASDHFETLHEVEMRRPVDLHPT